MPGKITDIVRGQYIVIETSGAQIQIAWGHGGLRWGTLKVLDEEPSLVTPEDRFNIDHRGTIVAIGSPLTRGFLRGAAEIQVKGVLAPSMHASLIPMVEELPFPVGLTQGFGIYPMSGRILSLLNTYNGREIAIDMGMVSDWREKRPEIIIPLSTQQQGPGDDRNIALELEIGQKVRILQTPYLGEIGTVSELRADHYRLPSGIWSPGAMVEVPAGDTLFIPIANLEQLG